MEIRRFFILETLLSDGSASERDVMARLWKLDESSRAERNEPWAWYYNTTKCFKPMADKGWIKHGSNEGDRKVWVVTKEGVKAFLNAVQEEEIFQDSLYVRKKNKVTALASQAV